MKKIIIFAFAFCFAGTASAALIDFRTAPYASSFGPNQTTDTVNGVNFTIVATARGVNGFRQNSNSGLTFGVPGNGMYSLSIVSDADVEYTGMVGRGHTLTNYAGQLPFDFSVNSSLQLDNLMFASNAFSTESLSSIFVNAGETFLIDVDFNSLTGNSIYASATLQSLSFNAVSTPATVPLPSTLLLLTTGLGLLKGVGFRKKRLLN